MQETDRNGLIIAMFLCLTWLLGGTRAAAESEQATLGACCLSNLTCEVTEPGVCDLQGGFFQGGGTDCSPNPCAADPTCQVVPSTIDFGTVGVSQYKDKNFRVTNSGGQFLHGVVSEACIEFSIVGSRNYDLGPGQSKVFTLRYAPQKQAASSCGVYVGESCPEVSAVGSGDSAPHCDVSPPSLDFGNVTTEEGKDLPFTITNNGGGFLSGNVIVNCSDFFLAGTGGYNLAGGESKDFVLRFLPDSPGERVCLLELEGCGYYTASGVGQLPPSCVFDPNPVLFDTTFVGDTSSLEFIMTNGGGGVLAGELDLSCQDFQLIGETTYSLAPGETLSYVVSFEPGNPGGQLCEIRGEQPCDPLSVVGHGAPGPLCALSAENLEFDEVYLGESSSRVLRVTNDGASVLVGILQFDCAEFTVVGSPDFALGAGEYSEFEILFSPTSTGESSCVLALGDRCAEVLLTGSGDHPPTCSVDPSQFDFGEVPLQATLQDSLVVTNLGEGLLECEATLSSTLLGVQLVGETVALLAKDESYVFRFQFQPVGLEAIACTLSVSDRCDGVTIVGTGVELPECTTAPAAVSFEAVPIGEVADTTIFVTNTGSGILYGAPLFECEPFQLKGPSEFYLAAGESLSYSLTYTPTLEVDSSCQVIWGEGCAPLQVTGSGLGPVCSVDAPHTDFGRVIPGKAAVRTVVVTNVGGGLLSGDPVSACSVFSVEDEYGKNASYALKAGESQSLRVLFSPTHSGLEYCDVSFGPECDSFKFSGSGGEPTDCELTPDEMNLVVEQGVATTASAVVTNRGQGRLRGSLTASCDFLTELSPAEFSLTENESARIEFVVVASALGEFDCQVQLGTECVALDVHVSVIPRRGACCLIDGTCRVIHQAECHVLGGLSWDETIRCDVSPCRPQGACCLIDGGCRLTIADECPPGVGTYLGNELLCDPDPCPTAGACCLQTGACTITTLERCLDQSGFWSATANCASVECLSVGACCLLDERCIFASEGECDATEGYFLGAGVTCVPEPCTILGACCSADGECRIVPMDLCRDELAGLWSDGVSCGDAECRPRGACCLDDGACIVANEDDCPGRYLGNQTFCAVRACRRIGPCCDSEGSCSVVLETTCDGTFLGPGDSCDPSPCRGLERSVQVVQGSSETLFQVAADGDEVEGLVVWYRRGGEVEFSRISSFDQDGFLWTSEISPSDFSLRGIQYYLEYLNTRLNLTVRQGSAESPRAIALPEDAVSTLSEADQYYLLSLPGELEKGSFGKELESQFGQPGRTNWRLGSWSGPDKRYLEHAADFDLVDHVGRGYWLAFAEETLLRLRGTTRFPAKGAEFYQILLAPGWNMIGNPAAYPISVDPLVARVEDGGVKMALAAARPHLVGSILTYDPATAATENLAPYRSENHSLAVWEGAWLENRTSRELTLWLSTVDAGDGQGAAARAALLSGGEPALQMTAGSAGEIARVELNLDSEAEIGIDSWDVSAPPPSPGRKLSLYWEASGSEGSARKYLRQGLPSDEQANTTFVASSELPIALSWKMAPELGFKIVSMDSDSWPSLDLRSVSSIHLPAGTHRFRLEQVSEPVPGPGEVPEAVRFSVEPNPVRETARLVLELPHSATVQMDLFDAAGKRVSSEDRGLLSSGRHLFVWNGQNQRGERLPTGTYFAAVRVDGQKTTKKLLLFR